MGWPHRAQASRLALRYEISAWRHSPTSALQTVCLARSSLADEALLDVAPHPVAVSRERVAVAAAARHQDLHLVAAPQRHAGELRRRHRPELLDKRAPLAAAAAHPQAADRTLAAAEHAPRLGLHAV